jgi:hypothetical protein
MRAGHDTGRVGAEGGSKVGMAEGGSEMRYRLPHSIVHEDVALADGPMKLGGNVTGLLLHPVGIGLPGLEQSCDILGRDGEEIDEDDGRQVHAELLVDGTGFIEGFQGEHDGVMGLAGRFGFS